ncbi:MAG: preprotein translocase subunit SecG [Verrucomicrobiota bacterium]|jgi:preprotein translocase subunit SecG
MATLINFLLGVYVLTALLMVLVILMQRPKSEGLGAAFGGGVTENIFGAQTTNVLTKITSWLAAIFFALTFALSILYSHKGTTSSAVRRELMKTQATAPATTTVPAASPSTAPAGSPPASAPAVGIVPPASAPLAPSATPAASTTPKK